VKRVKPPADDVGTVIRTTTPETGDISGLWNAEGGDDLFTKRFGGIY